MTSLSDLQPGLGISGFGPGVHVPSVGHDLWSLLSRSCAVPGRSAGSALASCCKSVSGVRSLVDHVIWYYCRGESWMCCPGCFKDQSRGLMNGLLPFCCCCGPCAGHMPGLSGLPRHHPRLSSRFRASPRFNSPPPGNILRRFAIVAAKPLS